MKQYSARVIYILSFCSLCFFFPGVKPIILECGEEKEFAITSSTKVEFQSLMVNHNKSCVWYFRGHGILRLTFDTKNLPTNVTNGCHIFVISGFNPYGFHQKQCVHLNGTYEFYIKLGLSIKHDSMLLTYDVSATITPWCYVFQKSCEFPVLDKITEGRDSVVVYSFTEPIMSDYLPENPNLVYQLVDKNVSLDMVLFEENLGRTVCYNCDIKLPHSDTPSCHAELQTNCQWRIIREVSILTNLPFLRTKVFAVNSGGGQFATISENLQLHTVCIYLEYISQSGFNPKVELSIIDGASNATISFGKHNLKLEEEWSILKIVESVPQEFRNGHIKLLLEFSDSKKGIVLVNKISGCHPFAKEDRVNLVSNSKPGSLIKSFMKPGKKFEAGVCSNGGIWMNGECDCPVGFIGDKCNEGCGPNRFGPSCEAKCSETDRMCREMIFCKRFFGCYCAPGYKGKYCSKICAANEYGVSCSQNCGKCLRDGCDPYTGRCPSGCLAGYVPPTCHTKYVHLIKPPSVEADFNNASLKVDIKNSTAGIGEPQYYQIQIRDDTFKNWTTSILEDIPADGMILFNITNLKAGTRYYCRVVLLDINGEKYEGDETPASSFETKCINDTKFYVTNTSSTYNSLSLCWESTPSLKNCPVNASVVEILIDKKWVSYTEIGFCLKISNLLPDSAYIIKIKPINAPTFTFLTLNTTSYISGFVKDIKVNYIGMDEVELEWTPIHNSLYSLFNVSYLCLRIVADESLTCGCDRGTMETGNTSIRITGLKPFRKYRTEIKEIGGQGHSEIKFTTQQALPAVKVRSLTFLPRKSSAFVSWEPPENCSDCNGYLRGYHLSLKDPIGVVKSHSTKNTSELFQNLKPQYIYQLSVYVQNVLGWNEAYPVIADLKAEIERPSRVGQLEVYKQSRTQLGLRWDAPKFSFGTIVSYTVKVDAITFTHEPVACQAWPQKFCYTVNGLRANTYYNVSVSARNGLRDEDGEESWIVGQTMERAPGKPIDVKQINVTETSITLRWGPPNLLNGILKSFLLKIEQVESYDNEACCQYYPKSELNVNDERESYWVEIKNLHPGSTFAVSVMGETLWLGPAAGIDAFTRPPRPCSTLLPVVQPPLRWEDHPEEKCIFRQEPTLIQGHLLILINDNGGNRVIDPDLRCILEQELGTNFDMVAEYSKAVNVSLGSSNAPLNGSWGKLNNPPLVFGRNYTFVAFTVVRYNNLFNVASRYALPLNLLEADPLNEIGKQ